MPRKRMPVRSNSPVGHGRQEDRLALALEPYLAQAQDSPKAVAPLCFPISRRHGSNHPKPSHRRTALLIAAGEEVVANKTPDPLCDPRPTLEPVGLSP